MSTSSPVTVALVDPLWVGHHPMYFTQFTASFQRAGARVVGICPDPVEAAANHAADPANDPETARFHPLPTGGRSFFNGRFEGDPVRTFQRWRRAADAITAAEAACGWKVDLVYFPYLDSYLRFLPTSLAPDGALGRPWSGLYLRNHHHGEAPSLLKSLRLLAKGDALIRSKHCRGIGVLDERFIRALEGYTGRRVTAYPDVTQADLPDRPFPLAGEIRGKAAGRKIVGMIGLEKRKGFLPFIRSAALAREKNLPLYFVAAGAIHFGEFTESEQQEIRSLAAEVESGTVENIHFDPAAGRIPDEADFNDLFRSFDIAWAAYEGFFGSSGTLSKAAVFELPCLATQGECIGNRVEKYRLGVTLPEASAAHAVEALTALMDGRGSDDAPLAPDFAGYRRDHSLERLDEILAALLQTI
ncbi:MAG: hypothetical protein H7A49_16465 [Akkermansiaceae bacterium]|nr:hypothetical protein [Akkermansiaceae bacterium]